MKASRRRGARGFTLIELMIVTAIIAMLASIAIPKFAETLLKSREGALKGNLGALRTSLQLYYGDNGGIYPACAVGPDSTVFDDTLAPKYIASIPRIEVGLHPPTNAVYCDAALVGGAVHDSQGWYYDGATPIDSENGMVWVACDHEDSKGSLWTTY